MTESIPPERYNLLAQAINTAYEETVYYDVKASLLEKQKQAYEKSHEESFNDYRSAAPVFSQLIEQYEELRNRVPANLRQLVPNAVDVVKRYDQTAAFRQAVYMDQNSSTALPFELRQLQNVSIPDNYLSINKQQFIKQILKPKHLTTNQQQELLGQYQSSFQARFESEQKALNALREAQVAYLSWERQSTLTVITKENIQRLKDLYSELKRR
jgi:hypothetical protein